MLNYQKVDGLRSFDLVTFGVQKCEETLEYSLPNVISHKYSLTFQNPKAKPNHKLNNYIITSLYCDLHIPHMLPHNAYTQHIRETNPNLAPPCARVLLSPNGSKCFISQGPNQSKSTRSGCFFLETLYWIINKIPRYLNRTYWVQ